MKMTVHEKIQRIGEIEDRLLYLTMHTSLQWSVDLSRKCWNAEYKGMGIKVYENKKYSKIGIGEEDYKVEHFGNLALLLHKRYPMKEVPSDEFMYEVANILNIVDVNK